MAPTLHTPSSFGSFSWYLEEECCRIPGWESEVGSHKLEEAKERQGKGELGRGKHRVRGWPSALCATCTRGWGESSRVLSP